MFTFTENQTSMSIKKPFLILFYTFAFMTFVAAQQLYNISGTLSAADEVPPTMSAATGSVTGTYVQGSNFINLTVEFDGLSTPSTLIAIHKAAVGINGPVIVTLMIPASTSSSSTASYFLSPGDESDFISGNTYLNVHSQALPGGEIRGQLSLVPVRAIPTLSQWNSTALLILLLIVGIIAARNVSWNHSKL